MSDTETEIPGSDFTNLPVEENNLPTTDNLEFEALSPRYIRTLYIEAVIAWIVLGISVSLLYFFLEPVRAVTSQWWFLLPVGILIILSFFWLQMVVDSRGFALREKDIHYKSGVIWQKIVSLPYNRVQHVERESNPLERIFKLSTLKFFTSGGRKADMKIPALTFERGSRLRAFVIEKAAADGKENSNANGQADDSAGQRQNRSRD